MQLKVFQARQQTAVAWGYLVLGIFVDFDETFQKIATAEYIRNFKLSLDNLTNSLKIISSELIIR